MKELFMVYTSTGDFSEKAVQEFIDNAKGLTGWNYDEIARYVYQDDNGRNILVECDVPTGEIDNGYMFITAYEYSGEFEDYIAEEEIACEEFNGDWNNLETFMKDMAQSN